MDTETPKEAANENLEYAELDGDEIDIDGMLEHETNKHSIIRLSDKA